ncbi:MAG: leucine--tRNA ligase [Candidatus Woesearchaeota archaeon]|nr:MAG: leucine--tRNA ligase [Candidatus Woesearchaeota archaeon]
MKDLKKIENKWQKEWKKSKIFEAEPDKRKKFFTSLVIAYPSGDLHIGHARTFTRSDIIARFKRMQGYNVLCTTGFHATGNRAVVLAKRIANKDKNTIKTLKDLYSLSDKEIKGFANKPEKVVRFFMEKGTETLNLGGFALDWRRRFISIDPHFSKFIDWQFRTLKKKGYVSKGSHPVIFCPKCDSPITQSDRDEGENAIVSEISLWKYKLDNGVILPAATLRPETIFAITNVFLHPDAKYVLVKVGKESWIVSDAAAKKLKQQRPNLEILDEIDPINVIGQKVSNPVTNDKMLVLPGPFINPDATTGVVASEPSDAPDDHIALEELKKSSQLARYNLTAKDIEKIKYKSLIKLEGYGDFPAVDICKQMKITSLSDEDKLLEAKKTIYKLQFHKGVMKKISGKFAGMSVSDAIEAVKKEYKNKLDVMYEPSERVTCKCGAECYIKLLQDQWFINYGNKKWKSQVKKYLKEMNVYPEFWRQAFEAALDWVSDKACVRKSGLGTPLPWDKEWVIETLSDSTIYMVFFIIDKFIKPNKIKAEQLNDDFFNYVLLGRGNCKTVPKKVLNNIKKDFNYWYPLDWRNSAKDLLNNHLLYFIYNHIAIFPKKNWPKTISVNGYVNLEGEKMSKSKGKATTFRTAIQTYGADVTRTVSVISTSPEQDSDWRDEDAENMVKWRNKFYELINRLAKTKKFVKENNSDKWLLSRSMSTIDIVTQNLEKLESRDAAQYCLYQMMSDFRWYLRRNNNQVSKTAKKIATDWVKLIAVYMPHISEELWKDLGQKGFISNASWPKVDKKKIDKKAEESELRIQKSLDDVQHILKIIGKKPKEIYLYVVPNELKLYKESEDFFSKEFSARVHIYAVNDKNKYDPEKKSSKAKPGKPGIYIE